MRVNVTSGLLPKKTRCLYNNNKKYFPVVLFSYFSSTREKKSVHYFYFVPRNICHFRRMLSQC